MGKKTSQHRRRKVQKSNHDMGQDIMDSISRSLRSSRPVLGSDLPKSTHNDSPGTNMPGQIKSALDLVREYTRELVMFGGVIMAAYVYHDHTTFMVAASSHQEKTAIILENMARQLEELREYHRRQETQK